MRIKSKIVSKAPSQCLAPQRNLIKRKDFFLVAATLHGISKSWTQLGRCCCCCYCCSVTRSCPTLCDPLDCSPPRLLGPWDFLGKDAGVGCHFFLQGIFPTLGSNPRLLHSQADSLPLSHLGSLYAFDSLPSRSTIHPGRKGAYLEEVLPIYCFFIILIFPFCAIK